MNLWINYALHCFIIISPKISINLDKNVYTLKLIWSDNHIIIIIWDDNLSSENKNKTYV